MQDVFANFLTEEKVKEILSKDLPQGEALVFVGHGFSHLWGFTYYVGKSENMGVTAQLFNGCHIHEPTIMTMDAIEEFIRKKKIEIFPFDMPPLQHENNRNVFRIMKEAVEKSLEPEEEFVTLCRASKFLFKNFLIGITDQRILLFKLKPTWKLQIIRLEETYSLSDVAEMTIPYGPFGAESLPIRVPLIDTTENGYCETSTWIHIKSNNGKEIKYKILGTFGRP